MSPFNVRSGGPNLAGGHGGLSSRTARRGPTRAQPALRGHLGQPRAARPRRSGDTAEIAARTGLDVHEVDRAIEALHGTYIREYQRTLSGGDPSGWYVTKVTAAARRAVGQWPTAHALAVTAVDRRVSRGSVSADGTRPSNSVLGSGRHPLAADPGWLTVRRRCSSRIRRRRSCAESAVRIAAGSLSGDACHLPSATRTL
jgi:hypothetical protein